MGVKFISDTFISCSSCLIVSPPLFPPSTQGFGSVPFFQEWSVLTDQFVFFSSVQMNYQTGCEFFRSRVMRVIGLSLLWPLDDGWLLLRTAVAVRVQSAVQDRPSHCLIRSPWSHFLKTWREFEKEKKNHVFVFSVFSAQRKCLKSTPYVKHEW